MSGSASRAVYGRKTEMMLLGIDRDGWALIHLYLGYFLLALVVLHIFLHWKQVLSIYRKWIPNASKRLLLTVLFIVISLFLIIFPFILQPVIL